MSPHLQNEVYTPLPPKLPPKPKHHNDDPIDHIVEERSPRIRKVRVIHDDPDAHPHVERPPSRGRRNSGKHHVADPPMAAGGPARPQYQHRRPEPEVGQLIDDLERERRERREAERLAAAAEEEARRLKAEMARERRQRSLERRERDLLEVERRLMLEEQDRLRGPVRRPRDRGDVVVVQPSYPVLHPPLTITGPGARPSAMDALDHARKDYRLAHPELHDHDPRRPIGGETRPRRRSVVIVDDDRDRDRNRGRGRGFW
ncbi:hypothetical protein HRR83_001105 [Exophiala dermatitidis]|uniref:Uncharacterized protein n=1 Tax=Exophiala dermatitidis TaxID=5970 RepID=A0AAN6IXK9_EXODE|nr:hypothetical protein HRR75_001009 [Exophiala dermatitidis]KAJ4525916.1 hypothetical protein HRR74_001109 [Exophiala dermatitidis]KAJ4527137.1 hypothetical protein HRR73_001934 [Exophiala dermatitidis]KAJ4532858.1 hypothetical protein HRR76_007835 [Exophiala dermatitidis]KAJ4538873.1 hypothetical protein HRR77_006796 [Exophiala dermatitidis]